MHLEHAGLVSSHCRLLVAYHPKLPHSLSSLVAIPNKSMTGEYSLRSLISISFMRIAETIWKVLTFIRRLLQFPHPERDL